jgi:hypothetical protein
MSTKSQHVTPHTSGAWSLFRSGSGRASRVFRSRDAAIAFARGKAMNEGTALYVHGADGMVREKTSYEDSGRHP